VSVNPEFLREGPALKISVLRRSVSAHNHHAADASGDHRAVIRTTTRHSSAWHPASPRWVTYPAIRGTPEDSALPTKSARRKRLNVTP